MMTMADLRSGITLKPKLEGEEVLVRHAWCCEGKPLLIYVLGKESRKEKSFTLAELNELFEEGESTW